MDIELDVLQSAARFFERLQDVDPTIIKLLTNVEKFGETGADDPGLLILPLISAEESKASTKPLGGLSLELTFSGEAQASLESEAGDLLPYPAAPKPGEHLRITARGSLASGAGAALPFTGGKFGASGEAAADASLSYFFQSQPQSLYVVELASSLPRLCSPFNYSDIISAMREDGLDALALRTNGMLLGRMGLTIAQPGILWGPGLPGSMSFSFSAEIRKKSRTGCGHASQPSGRCAQKRTHDAVPFGNPRQSQQGGNFGGGGLARAIRRPARQHR